MSQKAPIRRPLVLGVALVLAILAPPIIDPGLAEALSPPSVSSTVLDAGVGGSGPLGDVVIAEAAPGQLHLGDVITLRFEDSASGATLHFSAAATPYGTNGLLATVALASSNTVGAPLDDEMKVTITSTSGASSFAGSLTISGLVGAVDAGAATGNDKVVLTDTAGTLGGTVTVADADLLASGTLRAPYTPDSTPTILPTGNGQFVGSIGITEPAKSYFHAGDVVTFTLRDANGSADTVGLAAAPYAAGGSMTVQVAGINGPNVQPNDTAFNVDIVAADPANGSASTISVTNLEVNAAKAPLGSVTLTASITAGPDVGTDFIVPGRVTVATVGGTTTTTAVGAPEIERSATTQPAGDVHIAMTAGSVARNDQLSLTLQTAGVTFSAGSPPIATVTSGSVVFSSAVATLSNGDTTATWTATTGAITASAAELGPIYYDLTSAPTAGTAVVLGAAGQAGSDFTPQQVTDAIVLPTTSPGVFATTAGSIPSGASSTIAGASVTYAESGAGATPIGSSLVLLSPYAAQIAAFRTTFTGVPKALATGGLTLGAGSVNTSAIVVATGSGTITAPPETAAVFQVTGASSSTATVTFSNLDFAIGSLVAPGTLLAAGVVEASGGLTTSLAGNAVVDAINTAGLGSSAGTTPPIVSLTEMPPPLTNSTSASFAFQSNESGSTFGCALDAVVISLACPTPITLPGLSGGAHTFTVQAFNQAGFPSTAVSWHWTISTTAPTAKMTLPTGLGSSLLVTFSEAVKNLTTTTVVLHVVPASGPPVAVSTTLSCATGSGAPVACTPFSNATRLYVQPASALVLGQHYSLALNPVGASPAIADGADNQLASTSFPFRITSEQDDTSAAAVPTWSQVSSSKASGGSYAVADLVGATSTFTFTGTAVTWLSATGPSGGNASVELDGVRHGTVDEYSATPRFQVAETLTGLSSGIHTLELVVAGTKGSSKSAGTLVVVDGFRVGSTTTQQNGTGVTYTWGRIASPRATDGQYAVADLAGSRYTITFRGPAMTWIGVNAPTGGEAHVLVDGTVRATVNTYASRLKFGVAHRVAGLSDTVHTLTIVVLGRHGKGSSGNRVALDGFVLS